MSTLVLIISLMGGVSAFGFIGIVLGPLVAALLAAIVEAYYARPEEAPPAAPAAPADPSAPAPAVDAAPTADVAGE
jgi:predicted PurR-regulated permease PerM